MLHEVIDLSCSQYKDENGNTGQLPIVKAIEVTMAQDPTIQHEESPPAGFDAFNDAASRLVLGGMSPLIENRVCSVQTIGLEDALRLAIDFLIETIKLETIYVPDVTPIKLHPSLSKVQICQLAYFDEKTKSFNQTDFISRIKQLPSKSVVLLETGGRLNNSGVYPDNWSPIVDAIVAANHFPIVAQTQYGFTEHQSDLIRLLVSKNVEFFICQEFSHNLGLYDEPIGCLHLITKDTITMTQCKSQLCRHIKATNGSCPAHPARIVAYTLVNGSFRREWESNLDQIKSRLDGTRNELYEKLRLKATPGDWGHLIKQKGMYSRLGLNQEQTNDLNEQHGVLVEMDHVNISCINDANIDRIVDAIDAVARTDL